MRVSGGALYFSVLGLVPCGIGECGWACFRDFCEAVSLEGVFGFELVRIVTGTLYFGIQFSRFFCVGVLGEYVVGRRVLAETWARRAERLSSALRRPGHVGGAVARPP